MTASEQYTIFLAEEVLQRMTAGETVVDICRDVHMPCVDVVYRWARDDTRGFRDKYKMAFELSADSLMDEALCVARDDSRDLVKFGNNCVGRARVLVSALQYAASKRNPKKYGEKLDLQHSGEVTKRIHIVDSFEHVRFKGADGRISSDN